MVDETLLHFHNSCLWPWAWAPHGLDICEEGLWQVCAEGEHGV